MIIGILLKSNDEVIKLVVVIDCIYVVRDVCVSLSGGTFVPRLLCRESRVSYTLFALASFPGSSRGESRAWYTLRMRENLRNRASKRVRERTQSHGEE